MGRLRCALDMEILDGADMEILGPSAHTATLRCGCAADAASRRRVPGCHNRPLAMHEGSRQAVRRRVRDLVGLTRATHRGVLANACGAWRFTVRSVLCVSHL
eukprot:4106799-Prymnesium_polylepis.1